MFILENLPENLANIFDIFSTTKISQYLLKNTFKEFCYRVDFCGSLPL